jgi:peptide/nickel transport system permease protein
MNIFVRIAKNPSGLIGLVLVLFWTIVAILAPVIYPPENPLNPYQMVRVGYSSLPSPPSDKSPFGRTGGGYDILYGIVWGSRTAFRVGLIVVGTTAIIGLIIGGLGAFRGGLVDEITMRITDLFMSFPFMIAAIVITVLLGKGLDKVIIALIIFGWRQYARVMRSEVLSVKEHEFAMAAKSIGASRLRIFFRHILPNSFYPVIVLIPIDIGSKVLFAASLSFIGIGAEPGYASWGQMINFSRNWLLGKVGDPFHYWYTYVFPAVALVTFVLGWNLLGDRLRDVLDPRLRNVE